MQPGGRLQVAGVAPPLGSAAHLGGQRRVLGSRPTRGALPILQGSGHCRRPGGLGCHGRPGAGGEGGPAAGGEAPAWQPERAAGAVASPPALRARAAQTRGRAVGEAAGEGRGRRRRVGRGEERPVGGGRGRRGEARRGRGGRRAPGRPRTRPGTRRGAGGGPASPALGPRRPAREVRAATSPGGHPSARLSPGSGRARAAGGGDPCEPRSRRACLAERRRGWGLGGADPQTLPFFWL